MWRRHKFRLPVCIFRSLLRHYYSLFVVLKVLFIVRPVAHITLFISPFYTFVLSKFVVTSFSYYIYAPVYPFLSSLSLPHVLRKLMELCLLIVLRLNDYFLCLIYLYCFVLLTYFPCYYLLHTSLTFIFQTTSFLETF